jgi:hypothetical protein
VKKLVKDWWRFGGELVNNDYFTTAGYHAFSVPGVEKMHCMTISLLVIVTLLTVIVQRVHPYLEQGVWQTDMYDSMTDESTSLVVRKSLSKNSTVQFGIYCEGDAILDVIYSLIEWMCDKGRLGLEVEGSLSKKVNLHQIVYSTVECGNDSLYTTYTLVTDRESIYSLQVKVDTAKYPTNGGEWKAIISMKSPSGYLSAVNRPQYLIYIGLCVFYSLSLLLWLSLSLCHRADLLNVQRWIAVVILSGLIESVMYVFLFESTDATGMSGFVALILADMASYLKGSLARILIMTYSMGMGIVKRTEIPLVIIFCALGVFYLGFGFTDAIISTFENQYHSEVPALGSEFFHLSVARIDTLIYLIVLAGCLSNIAIFHPSGDKTVDRMAAFCTFFILLFILDLLFGAVYWVTHLISQRVSPCESEWTFIMLDEVFPKFHFAFDLFFCMISVRPSTKNQQLFAYSPLPEFDPTEGKNHDIDHFEEKKQNGDTSKEKKQNGDTYKEIKQDSDTSTNETRWSNF